MSGQTLFIPLETLQPLVDAIARRLLELQAEPGAAARESAPSSPWLCVQEAARYLSWPRQRLYELTAAGQIPHYKHQGRLLFHARSSTTGSPPASSRPGPEPAQQTYVARHGSNDGSRVAMKRRRVQRGIYRQQNGTHAVYLMGNGKPRFHAVGTKFSEARRQRDLLNTKAQRGQLPQRTRITFQELAHAGLEGFQALVEAGERSERTLETRVCRSFSRWS